jgi:hypothetical protein
MYQSRKVRSRSVTKGTNVIRNFSFTQRFYGDENPVGYVSHRLVNFSDVSEKNLAPSSSFKYTNMILVKPL